MSRLLSREKIYQNSPIPVQNLICSLEGWRINRRRYGSGFDEIAKAYEAQAWLDGTALASYQQKKLRAHMQAAAQTSYWRKKFQDFEVHVDAHELTRELDKLPVLQKSEVQEQSRKIRNPRIQDSELISHHTSGTTGSGLVFWSTRQAEKEQWAVWWRYRAWHGISRGDWCGYFGGRVIVPIGEHKPPFWRVNASGRQILFSGYHLSEATAKDYLGALQQYRPRWLHGYPSMLALLAGYIVDIAPNFDSSVHIITTGSENLLDHQKALIEKAFRCSVRQHYGLAEATANISECPNGAMHVDEDFGLVEFLPVDGVAKLFRLVGTNWTNAAFPLLRYETGDTVRLTDTSCDCGRAGRVVESVDGRREDYVILSTGARVGRLDHIFKDLGEIKEAQVLQQRPGSITMRIVRGSEFSDKTEGRLLLKAKRRLGSDMQISIEYVNKIPRSPAGKLRFVISDIAN